ncbi:AMP-binding protein [Noviherbaspirillum pedocola]|uniref:AMP-binding protein n=1 Tax=Noviherbaspirillum pedocola TaxID=2801341 RepID=A0A934W8X9_9BURK|nr:AMP-binding protein [Noviherbaspirillum pedocola]MBK4739197.1 AMP-binding protein [Noviherbaspirillum pedocola]
MPQNPSYVHGAHDVPLIGQTIGTYLRSMAERFVTKDAVVVRHQHIRWTYKELDERVSYLAAGLLKLGLHPGDRVGIWAQNCAEWVLVQFATARAGLIMVNINPAYRRSELEYVLDKVQCSALILSPSFKSSDYIAMVQDVLPEIHHATPGALHSRELPHLRHVIRLGLDKTAGMLNFNDVLGSPDSADLERLAEVEAALQFDDPVNIQFTSGTTGAPKGATLTHHNILNNGFFIGEAMRLTEEDKLCIPVPLYHCFGMVLGNLACVTHGATMVYPDESFEPKAVLETVQAERCTALHGVPTMFIAILDHPDFDQYDLSTLRTGIMAGSPCPAEVMSRVITKMHLQEITIAYGMTETSPASFQSSIDDPVELRVSTIGRVHPHLEVKIVDTEGRIVPRGVKGELLTRGYSVMLGYWGDEEKTRETVDAAGWLHTGDLAVIDDHGFATIVGRSKDMVIRGGENIYPREVEEFLYRHPKVLDVQCVGVPDKKYGEELCACIVLRPGMDANTDEIQEFCKGQIAHYKIPRYVVFVPNFPMTVTGKIQKYLLREKVSTDLGLAG